MAGGVLGGVILLAGCSSAPAKDPQGTAPAAEPAAPGSERPAPTQSAEPEPEPIVLPDCEEANATAEGEQATFFASGLASSLQPWNYETEVLSFAQYTGPSAQDAAAQASQRRVCSWALYTVNAMTQTTAELPPETRDSFLAALRDSDYIESARGAATVFTHVVDRVSTSIAQITTTATHIFLGDVWITIIDTGAENYEQAAIDAVLAANPALADGDAAGTAGGDATASDAGSCASEPVAKIIEAGVKRIAPRAEGAASGSLGGWDLAQAIAWAPDSYDQCAALSWVLLPTAQATGSSPTHLMFFSRGEFVGTDSAHGIAFRPTVTRISDDSISADYLWMQPGEITATASGRAVSTYTWDAGAKQVVRTGELPPNASGG
ncbi:hypothetical protein FM113_02955 [Leucobacter sp. 7(1)]|uniref:LppP/LprE family lipoprotein n=1 Tax=Leucobacter sp. 7(1) TaxID=1255613 RepID=UPI00097EB035|nr:LppP/LprE family lipoprotein [Leucobacter sp. 7(1)]SJN08499.1 hypothetical protein FM113_02955 [Leucobacter sp. 7(1)]